MIAIRAAVLLAAALATTWGCCDDPRINLSRIGDFLNGVLDLSLDLSIDELVSFSFDGDFAGWAGIPAFSTDEIEVDLTAAAYFEGDASFDIDLDALKEDVRLIAADVTGSAVPVLFATWRGDKYTADKGVCYLGWVDETRLVLAATWCGDDSGVMYCWRPDNGMGDPSCELCETSTGGCTGCAMNERLTACLPPKPASIDVDVDIDIDIDIDIDMDMDVGGDTCGAP